MEIIILSKSRGTTARFRIGLPLVLVTAITLATGSAGLAYWGYTRGGSAMVEEILNNPERSAQVWQREIINQRQFLNSLNEDMSGDLSALSGAIGRMQSQLTRLDAVAERVAKSARLDVAEFDLGHDPAIGGPQPEDARPPEWTELLANLDALRDEVGLRGERLDALEALMQDRLLHDDMKPDGQPLGGGWISSAFGYRTDPVTGGREFHDGLDFVGKPGEPVRAVAAGVVIWSGKRWGYGNLVEVSHGNGYITRYAHNRANLVAVGEKVDKNQSIALLGSTGRTTGPHVHFEVVHNGEKVNPIAFVGNPAKLRVQAGTKLQR